MMHPLVIFLAVVGGIVIGFGTLVVGIVYWAKGSRAQERRDFIDRGG